MQWLETLVEEAQGFLGEREREALWTRGVSDEQIDRYQLGYLDRDLPTADYPPGFLKWWNKQPRDDVFILPLTNTLGHVRGLQLRHVDLERKGYTDYIADKEEPVLFGLAQAMPAVWETEKICLVEGVFDLLPLQRHIPPIVSTLHAGIPKNFWRILRRLVTQIDFAYDNDPQGIKVAFGTAREYAGAFRFNILQIPKVPFRDRYVKDPNELWGVWGDERLASYLENDRSWKSWR